MLMLLMLMFTNYVRPKIQPKPDYAYKLISNKK